MYFLILRHLICKLDRQSPCSLLCTNVLNVLRPQEPFCCRQTHRSLPAGRLARELHPRCYNSILGETLCVICWVSLFWHQLWILASMKKCKRLSKSPCSFSSQTSVPHWLEEWIFPWHILDFSSHSDVVQEPCSTNVAGQLWVLR